MQEFAFFLQSAPAANPSAGMLQILPFVAMAGIFYVLVFMPMQRQKKQQAQMLASLEAGSEVVTTGGIVGTIVNISGDMLVVRVKPDNVKLQIARSAVASVVNKTESTATEKK
jgi:preprotein translocase subunit YajC